jgi:hypothetical protein
VLYNDAWLFVVDGSSGDGGGCWELIEAAGARPSPRSAHVAVWWAGALFVHGGLDEGGVCADLWRLELPVAGRASWSELRVARGQRIPRAHHSGTVLLGRDGVFLVIVGGQDASLLTCGTVHRLDLPETAGAAPHTWTRLDRDWRDEISNGTHGRLDDFSGDGGRTDGSASYFSGGLARIDACVLPLPCYGGWVVLGLFPIVTLEKQLPNMIGNLV